MTCIYFVGCCKMSENPFYHSSCYLQAANCLLGFLTITEANASHARINLDMDGQACQISLLAQELLQPS